MLLYVVLGFVFQYLAERSVGKNMTEMTFCVGWDVKPIKHLTNSTNEQILRGYWFY